MKIGAFARKFNLTNSTIRFYMQNGLLFPTKMGGQYEFDQKCITDMEKILRYKKYNFSIEEMQHIMFLENTSNHRDSSIVELTVNLLRQKRNELITAYNQLANTITDIEQEIESYPSVSLPQTTTKDLPFSLIPNLCCPKCGSPLQMSSVEIANGRIHSGKLFCEQCQSYEASVDDGIILCRSHVDSTPFKVFDNIDTVFSLSEESSPAYRMLIQKTYIWMYNQSAPKLNEANYIMTGPFTFNFLLTYINKIHPNSTIIICDPSIRKIQKMKFYLSGCPHNIVYIAGMPQDIPLRKGLIDLYFDDYSMTDYCFTYGEFPVNHIAPLLKGDCEIYGIFSGYSKAPKTISSFQGINTSFHPAKMHFRELKKDWYTNHVSILEKETMGSAVIEEDLYPEEAKGEEITVYGYFGRKKRCQ